MPAALGRLAAVLLLAGCLGAAPPAPPDAVLDDRAAPRPDLAPLAFLPPLRLGGGQDGAEPTVAAGPGGVVVVENLGAMWRSADGGRTFEPVGEVRCAYGRLAAACPPGYAFHRHPDLAGFGGDGDVAVDAAGRLHWVGLCEGDACEVPYQVSADGGATWSAPVALAAGDAADRQWIDVLPNGTLHVVWRGDAGEPEVRLTTSWDGGATWSAPRAIGPDRLTGQLVHDPLRPERLYLPMTNFGDELSLAASADGGATWEIHPVAALVDDEPPLFLARGWHSTAFFPAAAVDTAGTVYVAWSGYDEGPAGWRVNDLQNAAVFLAHSLDGGRTWSEPVRVSDPARSAVLPAVAAGLPGRVALAWYENEGRPHNVAPDRWHVRLVQTVTADGPDPIFAGGLASDEPVQLGAVCSDGGRCDDFGRNRGRLDFFELAVGPDGLPLVAYGAGASARAYSRVAGVNDAWTPVEVHFGAVAEGTPLT